MPILLLGLLVLIIVLLASKLVVTADPRAIVRSAPSVFWGLALLAGSALIAARGEPLLALPAAAIGLALLVRAGLVGSRTKRKTSRVRSAFVEMELDPRTGAMGGRVLADPHYGTSLDALPVNTLVAFLPDIDEESRALLMAYLDRRKPGWRENVQADATAGRGAFARGAEMAPEEAYQVLGIEPGASAEEIGLAHRTLMQKLQPDQGGSTYLVARVNEAKDILLRRHR
jgi:hypothetical protein